MAGDRIRGRSSQLARTLDPRSAETLGTQLLEAVTTFRGGQAPEDDETIIVLQRASDQPTDLKPLPVK